MNKIAIDLQMSFKKNFFDIFHILIPNLQKFIPHRS